MDPSPQYPPPTPPHTHQINIICKTCPRAWRTKAGTRVIGVFMERHPHPTNPKSILNAKLVLKNQVWGWLGCLWKGLALRVTTQWTDPQPHPTHPHLTHAKSILNAKLVPKNLENHTANNSWHPLGSFLAKPRVDGYLFFAVPIYLQCSEFSWSLYPKCYWYNQYVAIYCWS